MNDLTVLFLTVNKVPEGWAKYHRQVLEEAIGDTQIITISKKPLDWGINLIQEAEPSVNNIYRQILRGCNASKTSYIAIAEDDTLYHKSHFEFRPPLDSYAFNSHRWGLFTWGKPTYYWKDRISNACMIAPRQLVIDSLNERFAKYPDTQVGELGKEKGMNIDRRKSITFYSEVGVIFLSHKNSLDPTEQHKSKKMGEVQAYDIPYWGKAEDIRGKWI
jgi:hypothetical protein